MFRVNTLWSGHRWIPRESFLHGYKIHLCPFVRENISQPLKLHIVREQSKPCSDPSACPARALPANRTACSRPVAPRLCRIASFTENNSVPLLPPRCSHRSSGTNYSTWSGTGIQLLTINAIMNQQGIFIHHVALSQETRQSHRRYFIRWLHFKSGTISLVNQLFGKLCLHQITNTFTSSPKSLLHRRFFAKE